MKKLYISVERCDVIGGAEALSPMVTNMDIRLQELASETERVKGVLFKFAGHNSSDQYKKAAVSVYQLSEKLYEDSEALNEMQSQIVKYQIAIARFNEKGTGFSSPNRHNVQKVKIDVQTNHFQFTLNEMIEVNNSIQKYVTDARSTLNILKSNKEQIGSIWKDPQYKDFSEFIDGIISATQKSLADLEAYHVHLQTKIKELNN